MIHKEIPSTQTIARLASSLMTHRISGVAEDLLSRLVDCNIQHSGVVTQQRSYRTCGHKSSPQSDCSVTTSCDHQLQRCIVVKTFSSLK